jgi:hypothetical protein
MRGNDRDKIKVILLAVGIVIMFGCLISFIISRNPLELFGSSVGMVAFVYGFYCEGKKVNVTINYFLAMLSVNLFQWLILGYNAYIASTYHAYGPTDTGIADAFSFAFIFTMLFYIQIRQSGQIRIHINWSGLYINQKKIF